VLSHGWVATSMALNVTSIMKDAPSVRSVLNPFGAGPIKSSQRRWPSVALCIGIWSSVCSPAKAHTEREIGIRKSKSNYLYKNLARPHFIKALTNPKRMKPTPSPTNTPTAVIL
jgi:hypothetical protein